MISQEEFESRFPAEVQITQDMIDLANPNNPGGCLGAICLLTVLPELQNAVKDGKRQPYWGWGRIEGVCEVEQDSYVITTQGEIDMMTLDKPTKVKLIISERF
jgi:hypothetical protein